MGFPADRIIDVTEGHYPKSGLSLHVDVPDGAVADIETLVTDAGEDYPEGVTAVWIQFSEDIRAIFDGETDPTDTAGMVITALRILGMDHDTAWIKRMKIYPPTSGTTAEIELLG